MELVPHSLSHSFEESSSSGQDDVLKEILSNIVVAAHDRVVGVLMDSFQLKLCVVRLEENLRAPESLGSDDDRPSVWKIVGLVVVCALRGFFQLFIKILVHNEAEFLFDVSNNFKFCSSSEVVAFLFQKKPEVLSNVSSRQFYPLDCVRNCVTFIDRNSVCDTISRVNDDTGCSS